MAMIEVKNLFYSYKKDEVYAVNDVSFTIDKGEILGFLGPSGAGKSTTQGVLSGLLELQKGDIFINGEQRIGKPDKAFSTGLGWDSRDPMSTRSSQDWIILSSTLISTIGRLKIL